MNKRVLIIGEALPEVYKEPKINQHDIYELPTSRSILCMANRGSDN